MALRALVVDYGGVLTNPLGDVLRDWAVAAGVDHDHYLALMRQWLLDGTVVNPSHALERGEIGVQEFERELAPLLRRTDGGPVEPDGLLTAMLSGMTTGVGGMVAVVRRARDHGLRTGLLSNSWGLDYDRQDWDLLFDAIVISGEVGLRKPERAIYQLAADRLGVEPAECVFVDDLPPNVRGAAAAGMVGIHHEDLTTTVDELETLFGLPFHDPAPEPGAFSPGSA
ncbi:MAG: HAD family phosphatase [Pseudonocardia sp.]|nr:HAD family phosphatase [Pseudonocardia sp.]